MKPTFTLTYGLGYAIEMPPYELNGKQVQLVDSADAAHQSGIYLAAKQKAALAGQVYDPTVGFATTPNVAAAASTRSILSTADSARAWRRRGVPADSGLLGGIFGDDKTVFRGGYSRIYGRLNGGRVVGSPVLGAGLEQVIQCTGVTTGGQCLGTGGVNPATAFRIGTDGLVAPLTPVTQTLAQPYLPGVNGTAAAGDGAGVDVNFRPDQSDELNFTIQRELSHKLLLEAGYIGRLIRDEYNLINIDAVPTMTTLDGQSFANAFANLYQEVAAGRRRFRRSRSSRRRWAARIPQYCAGYGSCTAAVAAAQKTNIQNTQVYTLWSALNAASSWTLGRTLLASPAVAGGSVSTQLNSYELAASNGWGNYNAAFRLLHGEGLARLDRPLEFHLGPRSGYGGFGAIQQFPDGGRSLESARRLRAAELRYPVHLQPEPALPGPVLQESARASWAACWEAGRSRRFSRRKAALRFRSASGRERRRTRSRSAKNTETATAPARTPFTSPYTAGSSAHFNVNVASGAGLNGDASKGGSGINLFADPAAVFAQFRPLILGLDTSAGGAGPLRGLSTWNVDTTASKDFHIAEKVGATLILQANNVFNHFQPGNPSLNIDSPQTWGVISSQANTPREMQFGLRVHF